MAPSEPTGVLLVGSIPLASADDVFTKLPAALPGRLHSLPDGETGERNNYIAWQWGCFPQETIYNRFGGVDAPADQPPRTYTLADIGPTRYDEAALASYARFSKLRDEGKIPPGVRFQVGIPPPINSINGFLENRYHAALEPLYEARLAEAVARIQREIPAADLAVQWDMTFDVMAVEHERGRLPDDFFKAHFAPAKEGVVERVVRLSRLVHADAEIGIHLCHGDYGHQHFVEPADTALSVELANDLLRSVGEVHPVAWLHLPVPKARTDDAYFEPLKGLELGSTKLFLGVIHFDDEEGTRARIATAMKVCPHSFGVANECGMGRTPPEQLDSILKITAAVSAPL